MHLSFYLAYCIYGGGQPPHFFKTFISRFPPTFWMQYYYVSHYHPFLDVPTRSHELIWPLTNFIIWNVWCGKRQNLSIFYKNRKIAKMTITFVKSMQITSYLNRSCISVRGTIPEHLAKIRPSDVILWRMTSFSYISPITTSYVIRKEIQVIITLVRTMLKT